MPNEPTPLRIPFADVAPALAGYTSDVLFGVVWELDVMLFSKPVKSFWAVLKSFCKYE